MSDDLPPKELPPNPPTQPRATIADGAAEPAGPVQTIGPGQIGTVVFWMVAGSVVILGMWSLLVISDCPKDAISQYAINVSNLVLGGFLSTVSYYFGRQQRGGPNDER